MDMALILSELIVCYPVLPFSLINHQWTLPISLVKVQLHKAVSMEVVSKS